MYTPNSQETIDKQLVERLSQEGRIFYSTKTKPDIRKYDRRVFGMDVEIDVDGRPVKVFVPASSIVDHEHQYTWTKPEAFKEGRAIVVVITGVGYSSKRGHYIETSEKRARDILLREKIREWNDNTWIRCTSTGRTETIPGTFYWNGTYYEVLFKVRIDDSGYHFQMRGGINVSDRRLKEAGFIMPPAGEDFFVHPVWRNTTDCEFHAWPVNVSQEIKEEWKHS